MRLQGKVALVTGAARGIGRAIAMRFAREGAQVVLADRTSAEQTLHAIHAAGGRATAVELDITEPVGVTDRIERVVTQAGGLDILVNNAGIIARGTVATLSYDQWLQVLDVNLNGTFNCCKAAIAHMAQRRYGRIVNITSVAGKIGDITAAPAYGTSKGAVNTLTKSLAREWAAHGITVNAVAPHAVETEMSAQWTDDKRRAVIAAIPLQRLCKPEEVASAALFLASDEAAFITGEVLNLNGGYLMD